MLPSTVLSRQSAERCMCQDQCFGAAFGAGREQLKCASATGPRKPRAMPAVARIFDGEKEAKLIALACSKPPKGRARWTLRLLENKVVELGIVDRASDSTIGRALKKTLFSPIAASTGSSRRRPTARS